MERRVIKFNLVGAICILILIISLIAGLIIYIPKKLNKMENNSSNSENQLDEKNEVTINQVKTEEKTNVIIDGHEEEITTKTLNSSLGYSMKYDINNFYVESEMEQMDEYRSLLSNTIFINVEKVHGNLDAEREQIYQIAKFETSETKNSEKAVIESGVVDEYLNENIPHIIKSTNRTPTNIVYNYYIKADNENYYIVTLNCNTNFEKQMLPIMEKMIETFEIL